jgi:adenine phosphoribosyltransferase
MDLKNYIRDIPDFPSPGILFRDITPLLGSAEAFAYAMEAFEQHAKSQAVEAIVGIEARGFLIAAPLARSLGKPLVPVRKHGKLPFETHKVTYALEYGDDAVEVHTDAITQGQRTLIVDDLLATGGTLSAAARLVEASGGQVAGLAVLIELVDLGGRDRLRGYEFFTQIQY